MIYSQLEGSVVLYTTSNDEKGTTVIIIISVFKVDWTVFASSKDYKMSS